MIEAVIFDVLNTGKAYFTADPTRLDQVFQPEGTLYRVSAAEMAKIRATWTDKPPDVRHGYPTAPTQVPCWAIVLADDAIDKSFLGNLAEAEDATHETIGAIEGRTYNIYTYGVGNDMARWYYKIAKNLVISTLDLLRDRGAENISWSGRELEPLPEMLPHNVVLRVLSLRAQVEEYYSKLLTDHIYVDGVFVRRDDVGGGVVPVEVLGPLP